MDIQPNANDDEAVGFHVAGREWPHRLADLPLLRREIRLSGQFDWGDRRDDDRSGSETQQAPRRRGKG
jgi:hypothetical protein